VFSYFPVSQSELDEVLVREEKPLYLFKITNKDLSYAETHEKGLRKSRGTDNLHTLYFKALMSGNQNVFDIGSGAVFFREKKIDYTDEQLKTYGIKQCRFNMGVYETFYTYWIHHRCNQTDFMGAMEYGIVRNNFYRMVVTGVNGIGNSVIEPDIMRNNYPNSYVDVEVNVNQN
jgi:CRISPR-associated protein Cpf1